MRKFASFTLIELMLYILLLSIVLATVVPYAFTVIQAGQKNSTHQEISYAARYITEKIKYEIRSSKGINTGTSNFDVNLVSNPSYQLSLVQDSPNNPVIFNISSGKLQITKGAGSAVLITPNNINITNLVFTNNSSLDTKTKNISYSISLEADYNSTTQVYSGSITASGSVEIRSN